MAAADFFIKIDGIEGESSDAKHKGQIEILSFAFGADQRGTHASGGGGGAGKAHFHDLSITKHIDKSSPRLKLACAKGTHIKQAVLTVRKAGGEQHDYLKYTLSDLLISRYQVMGNSTHDVIPVEQIHLNYGKIETEYKEQKADGTLGGAHKTGWDLRAHTSV